MSVVTHALVGVGVGDWNADVLLEYVHPITIIILRISKNDQFML